MSKQFNNPLGNLPNRIKHRAIALASELAKRESEALPLIELLPQQREFINLTEHPLGSADANSRAAGDRPESREKTFTNMYDFALMLSGDHPWRHFPKGYHGRAFCIGRKLESLALIYYKKLLSPGQFNVIHDEETGFLRAYRPKTDAHRRDEIKQGPPLLPERWMASEPKYWEKGTRQLKFIHLKNDYDQEWMIYFFSGMGDAPRGDDVDDIRVTEEQESYGFMKELYPRLMDRKGCFSWDFTPQDGTDEAMRLMDEAERSRDDPQADVRIVKMSLRTNPHIDQEEIATQIRLLADDDQVSVRIDGNPATKTWRMFSEFAVRHSGIEAAEYGGVIPDDWCLYVSVDPGWSKSGVGFYAKPPATHALGPHVVMFDELLLFNKTEDDLAREIARKLDGREPHAIIMDFPMSNRTEITGVKIGEYIRLAFERWQVRGTETGYVYRPGFRDTQMGASFVRDAIQPRIKSGSDAPRSRLLIVEAHCPNTIRQLATLRRHREKGRDGQWVYFDYPAEKQVDELYDVVRYAMSDDLSYHVPHAPEEVALDRVERMLQARRMKLRHRRDSDYSAVCLGPASASSNALSF